MAQPFNLTAQINLRGPTNTRAVASQIRKQLSGIKVKVDLDLKGANAKNIAGMNKQLQLLSRNARMANKDLNNLNATASKLGAGLGNLGANQAGAALGKVKQQAASTGKAISVATSQIQEFGKQSGLAIRRFAAFSAVTGVVYGLTNAINSAFKEFVQFDKEVVRLSQVTGSSVSALGDITKEITRLSTNLGVASSDLISVSVTLAQAGLSADETKTALEALAKSALAPSFDNLNETVEGSIALMRQFSISSQDLESALGSVNAVAAAFAVEAGDIIKAIQRTGGVFAAASSGVSQGTDALNEFIALFTSVRATTREGSETIATGLRTIFTRIQRGTTIEALKEFGITLTDVEGKFVGPYEAVRRLSEGLSGLDPRDLRFGQIVEELGGFRQIGKVIPLIQQFSTAQEALAVAQGGQGSLAKNAAQAQASLAVQFEKTRQSFVALIRDLGNSATFKGIATVALTTANAFITLAGALKPLLPLLTALTAIKGASILSEFGSGFLSGVGSKSGGKGGGVGGLLGFASGGYVPGQGNRDTVSAMLTPGEYVIRKKAVQAIGRDKLDQLNRGGRVRGYAGGGIVQRFFDGAGVDDIKIAKTGKINKSDIDQLSASQAEELLKNSNVQKHIPTIRALQKRMQKRIAEDNAPVYGLAGLYGSPREVITKAEDGTTVKLVGATLGKELSDQYENMMIQGFEKTVSDIGRDMAAKVNASTGSLTKDNIEKAGLYNAIGAYLEASVATLGAPYDKDETNDPIDFADGLGDAAGLFKNIPSDAPTDTTRTVFGKGKSPNDFLGQVNRFRAKQAKKFATGGSIEDTVPALLTPGEYVINKQSAKKLGLQKLNQLNRADRIQGFNKGGAVGFVQKLAEGGGVKGDRIAYLERIAAKLGMTVEQYEKSIRSQIIRKTERRVAGKRKAQTGLEDVIVKNLDNIADADVEGVVREKTQAFIEKMFEGYGELDPKAVQSTVDEIVEGMKQGLSVDEIKETSDALKSVLDTEITAREELVGVQEEMAKKLGFITSRMKVRDLDIRAQRSLEAGKFGAMDKLDLRAAQKSIETPIGRVFDTIGETFATKNIPGMKMLEKAFPSVADKVTRLGDKVGGVAGILGAGSSLLGAKLPDLAKSFDYFAGTVSETSEAVAGFTGALQKGGSFGLSGAVLGQQMFGRRGAAIGGAAGLAGGAISGFIEASVAKETENAFKAVTASASDFDKTLQELNSARTVEERRSLERKLTQDYVEYSKAIENSAQTIKDNQIWNAFSNGINSLLNVITTVASTAAAVGITGGFGGGGGRRRRPRRRRAYGGRVGLAYGGSEGLVPVNLAPGEGVLSPEMASQFTDIELQRLNNADRSGFGTSAGMLAGAPMGIVPGNGSGKVDNFKTNLAPGSYVIRSASMDALYAAHGGRIGRSTVSGRGFASGGRIARQGHAAGAVVLGTIAVTVLGTLLDATINYFANYNANLEKQLDLQIQQLAKLEQLTDISQAQSTNNKRYSERIIKASDPIEARDAAGQFILSEEERMRAYGTFRTDTGELNVLNRLGEQQARASLLEADIEIPAGASVQEFLDQLKTTDLEAYNKAQALVTKGHNKLRESIYLEVKQRRGVEKTQAKKEFDRGGAEVDQIITEELSRRNRPEILAQRMEIIGRSINKFTLNLKDVMDRLSASMRRVSVETSDLFNRLDQYTAGLVGPTATAGQARTGTADVLRNIRGYNADELDIVVTGIEQAMGGTEEVGQMGDLVRGLQVIQQDLPLILRQASGMDLGENQTQVIDEQLQKMFEGIDIGAGVERNLRNSILDVIGDRTGTSRQPLTFEELADAVPGLKEVSAAAEQAREVFLQYAEQQIEMNNRLGQASDKLAAMMLEAAQLGIKANRIQLESALELKRTFGETISLEELQAPFQAEINGLLATAGGRPDMTAREIGDAIIQRQNELAAASATPDDQTEALASGEIAQLTKEINAYQTALDRLANSTERADAAMQKIAEQERISAARRQGVLGFLGMVNDPQAMMNFIQEQQAMGAVMDGEAGLNDIVKGLQALQAMEGLMPAEEFAKMQQQFVQNALNIVAQAAGPGADFVKQLLEAVQKDFAVGEEERAKLNPELAAAIDAYKEAVAEQTKAVQEQQRLMQLAAETHKGIITDSANDFKKIILEAATQAAAELNAAAERIGLQDVQPIEAGADENARVMGELAQAVQEATVALRNFNDELEQLRPGAREANEALPRPLRNPSPRHTLPTPKTDLESGVQEFRSRGGIVYASKGKLINFQPKGTDTVPAMLTPGEFVINRAATQKNLPLLKAINSGSNVSQSAGASYASRGGIMQATGYRFGGGVVGGMLQNFISGTSSIEDVFKTFVSDFRTETNNFGDLITNLARVFPALNAPINIFGNYIGDFERAVNSLRNIEIKGPNIPDTIRVNSDTIRVELIAPTDNNYKLSDEDRSKITNQLEQRLKELITLGR